MIAASKTENAQATACPPPAPAPGPEASQAAGTPVQTGSNTTKHLPKHLPLTPQNVQNKQSGGLHHQRSEKRWRGGFLKRTEGRIQYVLPPRTIYNRKSCDYLCHNVSHLHCLQALLRKYIGEELQTKSFELGDEGKSLC